VILGSAWPPDNLEPALQRVPARAFSQAGDIFLPFFFPPFSVTQFRQRQRQSPPLRRSAV